MLISKSGYANAWRITKACQNWYLVLKNVFQMIYRSLVGIGIWLKWKMISSSNLKLCVNLFMWSLWNLERQNLFDVTCSIHFVKTYNIIMVITQWSNLLLIPYCISNSIYRCSVCLESPGESYYLKDKNLFCREDYMAKFAHSCYKCHTIITGPVMVWNLELIYLFPIYVSIWSKELLFWDLGWNHHFRII